MYFLRSQPIRLCCLLAQSGVLLLVSQTQTFYRGIIEELPTRWRPAGIASEKQTVEMDTETELKTFCIHIVGGHCYFFLLYAILMLFNVISLPILTPHWKPLTLLQDSRFSLLFSCVFTYIEQRNAVPPSPQQCNNRKDKGAYLKSD